MLYILFVSCILQSFGQTLNYRDFVIVILSQPDPYEVSLAENLQDDIRRQAKSLHQIPPFIHLAHEDFPHPGVWTILPVIPQLDAMYGNNSSYILFCQSASLIDMKKLIRVFQNQYSVVEKWFGHALTDDDPTIIHHFAFPNNPRVFKYPNLASGFVMTRSLLRRLADRLRAGDLPKNPDFSIDASHELALYVWQEGNGPELTHVDSFCAKSGPHCAIKPKSFVPCGDVVPSKNIYFAVKTCSKFHNERLPVVRATWGKHTPCIGLFSEVEDADAGTVNLGVPNTERGHCGKTMAILDYVSNKYAADPNLEWLVIADDDTILSVARLQQLLSCYNSSSRIALGERYGFHVFLPESTGGYNYITGGGGIVMSMTLVEELVKQNQCKCPSNSTPDDMYLGICLTNLGVPIIHSPHFHQARPSDYAKDYLMSQTPVSFHKHWMIDPIKVYKDWFETEDLALSLRSNKHTEL